MPFSFLSSLFNLPVVSQVSTAITLGEASIKLGRNISRRKYIVNRWRKPLKIAVFGSSGSGKSSFLSMLQGKLYQGDSTRATDIVKFQLPNGRRLSFYDVPGQTSYRNFRTDIKKEILKGEFHAIINVVCYGFNETPKMDIKKFNPDGEVNEKYLQENRRIELEQLKEWIDDIYASSGLKWMLTLINKEDIWHLNNEEVTAYYSEGEYAQMIEPMSRLCNVHLHTYCSKISPFGEQPMLLKFSEEEKYGRHIELIENIIKYIDS